jgi:hypothetical protein
MKRLIIYLVVLFQGCTTFTTHNTRIEFPETKDMIISIHKMPLSNPDKLGYVEIIGNTCKVYLKKYPQCLAHEIRHCFEGDWHQNKKSDEDC